MCSKVALEKIKPKIKPISEYLFICGCILCQKVYVHARCAMYYPDTREKNDDAVVQTVVNIKPTSEYHSQLFK